MWAFKPADRTIIIDIIKATTTLIAQLPLQLQQQESTLTLPLPKTQASSPSKLEAGSSINLEPSEEKPTTSLTYSTKQHTKRQEFMATVHEHVKS